jgi:RNA polymerase sigma factor (sigma-70 family)
MAPLKRTTPLTNEQRDLVERNIGFAFHVAGRWTHKTGLPSYADDAAQVALEALCAAARTFVPSRGKFSVWAAYYVHGGLRRFFRRGARVVPRDTKGTGDIPLDLSLDAPLEETDGATHLDFLVDDVGDISREAAIDLHALGPRILRDMRQQVARRIRGDRKRTLRYVDAFLEQELEGLTLEAIGQRRGVTRERARQLVEKARPAFEAWKADVAKEAA